MSGAHALTGRQLPAADGGPGLRCTSCRRRARHRAIGRALVLVLIVELVRARTWRHLADAIVEHLP